MNKNDDRKIKIISAIDEDIIDRNLVKRFILSQRLLVASHAKKRFGHKKTPWVLGSIAAVLLVAIGIVLFANLFMGGQVPVYKGMTVSRADGTAMQTMSCEEFVALAGTTTEATTTTTTTTTTEPLSGDNIYYAMPNDTVLITVHLDNPDSFEILSFTLNGVKYQSYQFEKGSDSEHLILEVKIPDIKGMHAYTIDAIKYVDGTEIKDVRMEGNKTVIIGVYTDDHPVANVSGEAIGFFDASFGVSVQDNSGLLEFGNGDGAFAVLYRGNEKLKEYEIDMNGGTTSVRFENLAPNTDYRYEIHLLYDDLSGDGIQTHVLYQKDFQTAAILDLQITNATQTSFDYQTEWLGMFIDGAIIEARLYLDGEAVRVLSSGQTVDGLWSDRNYAVEVDYMAGGKIWTVRASCMTLARTAPTVEIRAEEIGMDFIRYDGGILSDPDSTNATVTRVYLTEADGTELNFTATDNTFAGLLSAHNYYVVLEYTYDLKDGNGTQTNTIRTEAITQIGEIAINSAMMTTDSTVLAGNSIGLLLMIQDIENVTFQSVTLNNTETVSLNGGNGAYTVSYTPTVIGEHELCITALTYTLHGQTYTVELSYQTGCEVVVVDDIKIEKITFANGEYYTHSYGCYHTYYVYFSEGAEHYTFHSILETNAFLDRISLTKVSDRVYSFEADALIVYPGNTTWWLSIDEIQYGIGEHVVTKRLYEGEPGYRTFGFMYVRADANCIEVSTPADLQNMKEEHNYILVNDIDMTGIAWTPVKVGYLNGNGYQIKNLTATIGVRGNGDYKSDYEAIVYSMIKADVMRNVVLVNPKATWVESGDTADTSTAAFLSAYGMIGCQVIDGEMTVRQNVPHMYGEHDVIVWTDPLLIIDGGVEGIDCSASGVANNYAAGVTYDPDNGFWGVKTDGDWTTTYYWNGEVYRFTVDHAGNIITAYGSRGDLYYVSDDGRYFTIGDDWKTVYYDTLP